MPALGGAVLTSEGLRAQGVTGVRALGSKVPVRTDDLWHLGSCTKAMTATLVAQLVEEGRLRWESRLPEAFPDFVERMHDGWKPVTLELLLAHRGGVPSHLDRDGLWGRLWRHRGTPTAARRKLAEGVLKHPPDPPPGTQYVYANAGYALAGHAAERVTKTAWEDLIRLRLFRPLGIRSAGFGAPGSPDAIDQPWGHAERGGILAPVPPGPAADNPPAVGPAGTVHMSLADWAKFVALHLAGARDGKTKLLLKRRTIRRLHRPLPGQAYALGWLAVERPWGGGRVLTHAGSNTMWFAVVWMAPKKDFAVLATCNQGGDGAAKACDRAAWALIQWHLERAR